MSNLKKILFITGTRADYGKLKSLMRLVDNNDNFECYIFVTGMHLIEKYGDTYLEVLNDQYQNVYVAYGLPVDSRMDINCANTIQHLSGYVSHIKPDLIVVHGDRTDALCGALVGALNNIFVAHIEGGEISGTIDESIRHAVSKLSHFHFVANEESKVRLMQMGEDEKTINIIGSPDIDIMLSNNLKSLGEVKRHYNIPFDKYAIFMYHSVTTDIESLDQRINTVIDALISSKHNYVVIYPNTDMGSEIILSAYKKLRNNPHFVIYPSLRFEYFLTLLYNSEFIIGNSSAGIREACIYGIPAIDIGDRQRGRYDMNIIKNIQHVDEDIAKLLNAIDKSEKYKISSSYYGFGDSAQKFIEIISKPDFWNLDVQKKFIDRS